MSTLYYLRAPLAGLAFVAVLSAAPVADAGLTDAEKERFLREAAITSSKDIGVGVTKSRKLTLTDGGLTHHAHFQKVDERRDAFQGRKTSELNFRDCYRYNIAAYRLDRLLGLHMTPVSVERRFDGHKGALTWWVDDVLMMEADRRKNNVSPPNRFAWMHQLYQARLFNELVHNMDPNPGNVIIDKTWEVWLVDFTRSFRLAGELPHRENIAHVDRRVWEALLQLEERTVVEALHDVLVDAEIRALLNRRDALVSFIRERIARLGEDEALCDSPEHRRPAIH